MKKKMMIFLVVLAVIGILYAYWMSQQPRLGELEQDMAGVYTEEGWYVGQIDATTIEVIVRSDSGENEAMSYILSDDVRNQFDSYRLETEDSIEFGYVENQNGQNMIVNIAPK